MTWFICTQLTAFWSLGGMYWTKFHDLSVWFTHSTAAIDNKKNRTCYVFNQFIRSRAVKKQCMSLLQNNEKCNLTLTWAHLPIKSTLRLCFFTMLGLPTQPRPSTTRTIEHAMFSTSLFDPVRWKSNACRYYKTMKKYRLKFSKNR